jgi:hypothetical protein
MFVHYPPYKLTSIIHNIIKIKEFKCGALLMASYKSNEMGLGAAAG